MATLDQLLTTIESIHAAGLDEALWSRALERVTALVGGVGATFEDLNKATGIHTFFRFVGLPPVIHVEYADHYLAVSPRIRAGLHWKTGHVDCDYGVLDEAAMRRDPFYADFLPRMGLRYFVGGVVANTSNKFVALAVQRSARQGHAGGADIELLRKLLPHFQQAHDVARRLGEALRVRGAIAAALDAFCDGVALIRADGTIVHANAMFADIVRRADGIAVRNASIEIADATAQARYREAIAAVLRLHDGGVLQAVASDVLVPRKGGAPPYVVSVRPLVEREPSVEAVALVFVRDPLQNGSIAAGALRDLFDLTEAEAALAQALQSGTCVTEYARTRGLTLNTVYTHLRRLREKTGSNRLPELIHKLNELRLPLRLE